MFLLFLFEAEIGEVDEEDFEDDIVVRKFGWTWDNLSKSENHLMNE